MPPCVPVRVLQGRTVHPDPLPLDLLVRRAEPRRRDTLVGQPGRQEPVLLVALDDREVPPHLKAFHPRFVPALLLGEKLVVLSAKLRRVRGATGTGISGLVPLRAGGLS